MIKYGVKKVLVCCVQLEVKNVFPFHVNAELCATIIILEESSHLHIGDSKHLKQSLPICAFFITTKLPILRSIDNVNVTIKKYHVNLRVLQERIVN